MPRLPNPALTEVRDLLASLEDEMALLREVPGIAAEVHEIHRIVSAGQAIDSD